MSASRRLSCTYTGPGSIASRRPTGTEATLAGLEQQPQPEPPRGHNSPACSAHSAVGTFLSFLSTPRSSRSCGPAVQGQPGRPGAAIGPPGQFCRQATGSRLPWSRPWSDGLHAIKRVFFLRFHSPSSHKDTTGRQDTTSARRLRFWFQLCLAVTHRPPACSDLSAP